MLLRPLLQHAKATPDKLAIVDDRGQTTYGELLARAKKLAKVIRVKTRKGYVGILLPGGGGFVTTFYATLLAGKVPVPLNFLLGQRETKHVLADSGIDLVLTVGLMLEKLDAGKAVAATRGVRTLDLLTLKPSVSTVLAQLLPLPSTERTPDQVATILYTSGTSGLPKGVCLTHGNLHEDVHACIKHVELDREHVFLGIVPLFHSTGLLATMIAPIVLGSKVVYIARFSPQATIEAIRKHGVTVMAAVPSMYNAVVRLKNAGPDDFKQMYLPLSGGEPLPGKIREAFKEKFACDLMEGYGLTEVCGPMCVNMPRKHRPGSVGQVLPGVEVKVADDNGNALGRGETGEIWIKGPIVFQGYHKQPDLTRQVMTPDGYFKTGDLGHLDEEGYLFITGRKKDLIIVSGENVYPREIEEIIAAAPGVAEVAVVGRPDESRGEVPVAFVVALEGHEPTAEQIRAACREAGLPQFKIPKDVIFSGELPHSPTGKVLKRQLVEQLKQEKAEAVEA